MRKLKLFSLALMALFTTGVWGAAVVPSATWTVGDVAQLTTWGWANKSQSNSVYQSGDTVAINAYLAYQSVSNQLWIGYNVKGGSSSTETAWGKIQGFGGAEYYNVIDDKNSKYYFATTNSKDPRDYQFYVTNCIAVYVYGNAASEGRNINLKAYVITAGTPAETPEKSASYGTTSNGSFGITGLDKTKSYKISVCGDNQSNCSFYEIAFVAAPKSPSLEAITIAGVDCDIIALNKEDQDTISAELPFGTVIADAIAAITSSDVTLGGSATSYEIANDKSKLTVSDGTNTKDYIFNLTVSSSASTDATLKALSLNDVEVELENTVFEYDVELPYATTVNVVATANDPVAKSVVVDKSVSGTVTITVTAQADNSQIYTINYTILDAPKSLTRALFSNGFDAFIDTSNKTVKAYYLEGTDAPILSSTEGDGEAAVVGNKIVVTAADSKTLEFDLTLEEVTPNTSVVEEGATAGTFTGEETWIKAGLHIAAPSTGFSSNKYILRRQLRGSDPADDQRVIAGYVRAYFFVGNASKFEFKQGSNKGIKYAIDGGSYSSATEDASVSISLEAGNHMIEIVTSQSNGNCELTAPKLVKRIPTALDNTDVNAKAVKRLENGMLVIEKNGVRYNILGGRVQ